MGALTTSEVWTRRALGVCHCDEPLTLELRFRFHHLYLASLSWSHGLAVTQALLSGNMRTHN